MVYNIWFDVQSNVDVIQIFTKNPEYCKILCKRDYSATELASFADKISEEYRVNMMLDNLPAATKYSGEAFVLFSN